ncbi:UDP-N-acetylglucosamine acyltransferase [Loktanella sp. DSM 29012]|uniref:Acyl-[acyl-carrier-protein]--UDP-N-acetylglucosamine O-acyltransferase n=1 Tax=Loktanella gaetbuli TaxID=2881335 RepID=A0ABS8BQH5_9RHOB|nr:MULTISPECIES: acyl-ACP--UDP-N-acetylglucosamine O-acyltransferase [Loktanella]MCB5197791.1 acyl-ACP--UDP-N-acetylglucosamine O-acyltransferase [Loktanella gaetbuli]SEQ15301.1 UDP-N-acetylglucosamine acyltransferase [Loktanella sp. DSM 29012]
MSADIHPTAVVSDHAVIGANCTIGPFCMVGPKVVLGDGVWLKSHVVVDGDTHIGDDCTVFSFSVIGEIPQDLKFAGEETQLRIGKRNRIRESVTINTGTAGGGGVTRIGDDCLLMAGCHVAHDAQLGDRIVVVNSVAIAGHCIIEDDVIIGGLSGIHQFVRIGQGAIIGALSMVTNDVLPHGLVMGERAGLEGLNLVGLRRRGVPRDDISALRKAFESLKSGEGTFHARVEALQDTDSAYVKQLVDFVLGETDRSFLIPK